MSESKIGKPVKIALFRDPSSNSDMEYLCWESMEKYSGVRITEYIEVTFQPLSDESVAEKFVEALDVQERRIRNEFQKKLDDIAEIRRNLLAIKHKD